VGGRGMKDVGGAVLAGSSPPFLGREQVKNTRAVRLRREPILPKCHKSLSTQPEPGGQWARARWTSKKRSRCCGRVCGSAKSLFLRIRCRQPFPAHGLSSLHSMLAFFAGTFVRMLTHPAHPAQRLASPQRENPIEVPASPVPSNLTPTTVGVDWQEGSNPESVSFRTLRLARAVVSPAQSQAPFPDPLQMQPDCRKHAVCTGSTSASRPLVPLPRSLIPFRW